MPSTKASCLLELPFVMFLFSMGRRLEKYCLVCNSAFFSLFTMKFVRHLYIQQNILYVGTKKASKIYLKFLIYIGSFQYIFTTKYTLSCNKKRLQNMSEIFDMVHITWLSWHNLVSKTNGGKPEVLNTKITANMSTMPTLPELPQHKNIVDMLAVTFVFAHEIMSRKSRDTSARSPTWLIWTISKISDIFCRRFLFQLKVYFVVNIYRKFTIYFAGVFCSNLECILLYIYISDKFHNK